MFEVFFLTRMFIPVATLILAIMAIQSVRKVRRQLAETSGELELLREEQASQLEKIQHLCQLIASQETIARTSMAGSPAAAGDQTVEEEPIVAASVLPEIDPDSAEPHPLASEVFVTRPSTVLPPRRDKGPLPLVRETLHSKPERPAHHEPPQFEPGIPVTPPPLPLRETERAGAASSPPAINLEQFMGAKLFAWIGGLALFLGVIFFVKLGIERNWISPGLRTAIGFAIGGGLVTAGVGLCRRDRYTTLAHTLSATGIVLLYGVTFAAHAFWRIPPLDHAAAAFLLMTLITGAAFLIAVRLRAQVVAVLGMLGGFLTPVLCSTGEDMPFALFGFIALLDVGIIAVAKKRRWPHLFPLAAAGTIMTQAGWMTSFFHSSQYAMGAAPGVPVMVFAGFALIFTLAVWWAGRQEETGLFDAGSALSLCGSAMVAAFYFLHFDAFASRPALLYAFVLGINLLVLLIVGLKPRLLVVQGFIGVLTFFHLGAWTTQRLASDVLPEALSAYLAFGLLHTGFAVLMARQESRHLPVAGWLPVASLLLLFMPVIALEAVAPAVWLAILLVDLLVIGLAAKTGRLLPVLAALVLTLATAGAWLFRGAPAPSFPLASFLAVVGGFALLFGAASSFLSRKIPQARFGPLLPVSSAVLPFLLLILATLRLPIEDPSPVFALALLLVVFLLGLARLSPTTVLAPTALACVLALQWVWQEQSFSPTHAHGPLLWHLGFYALFTALPLVFHRQFETRKLPWMTALAAGIGTFSLVYRLVGRTWPNEAMGLLPVAFAIVPLLFLVFVLKRHAAGNPARLTQLAWSAGAALFFITLVFPIQFEKQWITLGWALEGAALCWLFRRIPHPGLRVAGTALLVAAFVRLALNPAVLEYQIRGEVPILNWQLYAYSLAALALFLGAASLQAPNHLWKGLNLRALFCSLGGILLFLLLNIEIADAFTPAGQPAITFDFSGNVARDMTYTIAWALSALSLLVLGIWKRLPQTRYAGIGLLAITLLKLFFHDLANIDSGYRIGALIAVALIALITSFLYQRFLSDDKS